MSTYDFDFSSEDPDGRVVEYRLPMRGDVRLSMVYAGLSNMDYTDHLARINAKTDNAKRVARGQIDAAMLKENLDLDRRLFSLHVVKGWTGVVAGPDRQPVAFSKEACFEYLKALPSWVMQDVSRFAAVATNFLPDDIPSDEEIENQAGN